MTDIQKEIDEALEKATEIKGSPGYFITSDGHVLSKSNWRGYGLRKLTQLPNSHGYMRVKMTISGLSVYKMVHKLVSV